MLATSNIPCGNGRIRWVSPESLEVELIAYSKGARYTHFRISGVEREQELEISLLPDACFRDRDFAHKMHADVWWRTSEEPVWRRVEKVDRSPERVRFRLHLKPHISCWVSTEPPISYSDTTEELFTIAARNPEIAEMHHLGRSLEDRGIFLLRITAQENRCTPGEEKRTVIHISAGEHATEFAGEAIARGILDRLLSPEYAGYRQSFIFDLILNTNPDGNIHGWHQYNLKDWREHNYSDTVDRSWHHELRPYAEGLPGPYSPETVAIMEWLLKTRPALYLSMHSWEGQFGVPGAFYTSPTVLDPLMGAAVMRINELAHETAGELGFHYDSRESTEDELHLGHYLMRQEVCYAYLPEGHYNLGFETLKQFGGRFFQRILDDPLLRLEDYHPQRWDSILGQSGAHSQTQLSHSPLS